MYIVGDIVDGTTFIFHRGLGGQLVATDQAGKRYAYTLNGLGDVVGHHPSDSTLPVTVNQFNAFGVPLAPSHPAPPATPEVYSPWGYRGEYTDAETGFVYLRHRYYNPEVGRFLTEDPIRADSPNWYIYCLNNPIMFRDPSGLKIHIAGDVDDRWTILGYLQMLSHYTLDPKAHPSGNWDIVFGEWNGGWLPDGTDLLRQVIGDDKTVINRMFVPGEWLPDENGERVYLKANSANPLACGNWLILMDFDNLGSAYEWCFTYNKPRDLPIPPHIALGHELVHPWSDFSGAWDDFSDGSAKGVNQFYNRSIGGRMKIELTSIFEFNTVGMDWHTTLGVYSPVPHAGWRFSENVLRREHGIGDRLLY
jgi:RHS repeat-associated protein